MLKLWRVGQMGLSDIFAARHDCARKERCFFDEIFHRHGILIDNRMVGYPLKDTWVEKGENHSAYVSWIKCAMVGYVGRDKG